MDKHGRSQDDIAYDLTGPCKDCPFLKATPIHQGILKGLPELVSAVERGVMAHTCHKTDPFSDSPEGQAYKGPLQHCAGLLTMMIQDEDIMGYPQVKAIADGKWDPDKMKKESPVWDSLMQMILTYHDEAKRLLADRYTGDTEDEDDDVVITRVRYNDGSVWISPTAESVPTIQAGTSPAASEAEAQPDAR